MPKALAAVIFDRDGVLNVDHGYVGHVERLAWMPGARRAVARLNAAGLKVIVATNQSGVARGFFDLAAVEALHDAMRADLAAVGGRLDAIYVCPFHEDAVVEAWRIADHPDRKPNPGMVLKALADFALDADQVVLVGDKPSDIEAARRAGVRGLAFPGGDLESFLEDQGLLPTRNNG
ncbi:D-glycero-alpha-D-manno-heptose-1,7-bisphosphate 7-phosphatase [Caulobacter sp. KR2-114]|uniref:D-glycero-alpha-D-manno-heptose-1,7-bisphosphate 7-phosphatase n=1 Tax=Caulobacter sp. KR2-114 TaxID=3400912 RepID=UPI003BFF819A